MSLVYNYGNNPVGIISTVLFFVILVGAICGRYSSKRLFIKKYTMKKASSKPDQKVIIHKQEFDGLYKRNKRGDK